MDDEETCQLIADEVGRLTDREAWAEHTGGYVICILIPHLTRKDALWMFGTANATWGGNLVSHEGDVDPDVYIDTSVSSESTDLLAVAQAIVAGVQRAEELETLTDEQLATVAGTPWPFDARINNAALVLVEVARRRRMKEKEEER